jgi:hypothetical protein
MNADADELNSLARWMVIYIFCTAQSFLDLQISNYSKCATAERISRLMGITHQVRFIPLTSTDGEAQSSKCLTSIVEYAAVREANHLANGGQGCTSS